MARVGNGLIRLGHRLRGRNPVAFVLSGGGNLGAVQVGMLRALTEAGITPDLIIGCSVGAINGAGYAAEPSLAGVERLTRIWHRLADGDPDVMPSSRLVPTAVQIARKGESIHDPARLEGLLTEELSARRFDALVVPFACVATDVARSDEHWFTEGELIPALMASSALPAVYPPLVHQGRTFIDGGVLREIHTHKAVELGSLELYVLHVGHLSDRAVTIARPFDAAVQAYWTARNYRFQDDLRRVPDHVIVHQLPAGSKPRLRFDDFTQARTLAEAAYEASSEYLRTGRVPAPRSGPESPAITGPASAPAAGTATPGRDQGQRRDRSSPTASPPARSSDAAVSVPSSSLSTDRGGPAQRGNHRGAGDAPGSQLSALSDAAPDPCSDPDPVRGHPGRSAAVSDADVTRSGADGAMADDGGESPADKGRYSHNAAQLLSNRLTRKAGRDVKRQPHPGTGSGDDSGS